MARTEVMPDCPGFDPPTRSRDHFTFLEAHDAYRQCEESERLGRRTGALVNAICETPSETAKGALEKLEIAYMAIGDGGGV